MLSLLAQTTQTLAGKDLYLPPEASVQAPGIDLLIHFIMAISILFTLIILAMMLTFAIKYRKRPGHKAAESAGHSTALELTWTIIPTVIVVVIFFFGFRGFLNLIVPPPNTYEIYAKGKMWAWEFTYPNGLVSPDLHVPANVPVRIILTSDDVIHALYIPAARVQKMNTPGRYNRLWFEPKFVDEAKAAAPSETPYTESHEIFCNMYCGTNHSEMLATMVVHRKEDFPAWLAKASDPEGGLVRKEFTALELGEKVYKTRGCAGCHSVDGSSGQGPSWKDVFGETRTFTDGSSKIADENYIHESIVEPNIHVVKGFNPIMPSFKGSLKDVEIDGVIAFMKTKSSKYSGGVELLNADILKKYEQKAASEKAPASK